MGLENRSDSEELRRVDKPEIQRHVENASWLSDLVNPARLDRIRQYPAFIEGSAEYALFSLLEADLNEKGADMDPAKRASLRNLVGVLRMVFYPNLTTEEQGSSDYVLQNVDLSGATYEVTEETREDVQWIFRTFGLSRPTTQQLRSLHPAVLGLIAQAGLNQS